MFNFDDEIIEDIVRFEAEEKAAFAMPYKHRNAIAIWMAYEGNNPSVSTGVHGYLTFGYGMLDHNGFWQYPLQDGAYVDVVKRVEA